LENQSGLKRPSVRIGDEIDMLKIRMLYRGNQICGASDTAWVETAAAKESIADFRNLKKYITKLKEKYKNKKHF